MWLDEAERESDTRDQRPPLIEMQEACNAQQTEDSYLSRRQTGQTRSKRLIVKPLCSALSREQLDRGGEAARQHQEPAYRRDARRHQGDG